MPITKVLMGWVLFRIIESFITLPLAQKALQRYSAAKLFLFSLILQGSTLILFLWSVHSNTAFGLLIVVFAVWDVIYWPIRSNMERFVVAGADTSQDVGQSVGLAGASSQLAQAAGLILAAVGIQAASSITFFVAAVGLLLSYLPLIRAHLKVGQQKSHGSSSSFFRTLFLGLPLNKFFRLRIGWILMARGVINELVHLILPLLLAYFAIQLIQIGTILSLLVILGLFANIFLAFSPDGRRHKTFRILGIIVFSLFALFQLSAPAAASVFLLLFGIFGTPWQTSIDIIGQQFVKQHFDPNFGGFFLNFLDVSSRIPLVLGAILLLHLNVGRYFYPYALFTGAIAALIILIAMWKHYGVTHFGPTGRGRNGLLAKTPQIP